MHGVYHIHSAARKKVGNGMRTGNGNLFFDYLESTRAGGDERIRHPEPEPMSADEDGEETTLEDSTRKSLARLVTAIYRGHVSDTRSTGGGAHVSSRNMLGTGISFESLVEKISDKNHAQSMLDRAGVPKEQRDTLTSVAYLLGMATLSEMETATAKKDATGDGDFDIAQLDPDLVNVVPVRCWHVPPPPSSLSQPQQHASPQVINHETYQHTPLPTTESG